MGEFVELFCYFGYAGFALLIPFGNYAMQVEEGKFAEANIMSVNIAMAVLMLICILWNVITTLAYKDQEKLDRMRKIVNETSLLGVTILAVVLATRIFPYSKFWGLVNLITPILFKLGVRQVIDVTTQKEETGEIGEKGKGQEAEEQGVEE